jgi:hypothetical protein
MSRARRGTAAAATRIGRAFFPIGEHAGRNTTQNATPSAQQQHIGFVFQFWTPRTTATHNADSMGSRPNHNRILKQLKQPPQWKDTRHRNQWVFESTRTQGGEGVFFSDYSVFIFIFRLAVCLFFRGNRTVTLGVFCFLVIQPPQSFQ